MEAAQRLGSDALQRLSPLLDHPEVLQVRGRGLMVAVEFQGERAGQLAHQVVKRALRAGMLLHTAGVQHEVIRLMPPLNIGADLWDSALEELVSIVGQVCSAQAPTTA